MELHPRVKGKIGKKKNLDGVFLAGFPAKFYFLRKVEFNAIETVNNNNKNET
jgi:hypothetical protein